MLVLKKTIKDAEPPMTPTKFMTLLWRLIPRVVEHLMDKKQLGSLEALRIFYNSELYYRASSGCGGIV
jgi:hypothetical protein